MRLEIDVWRKRNVVIVGIVHQSEELYGKEEQALTIAKNGKFSIISSISPEIKHNTLYIKGAGDDDNNLFCYAFEDEKAAKSWCKEIASLTKKINEGA